MLAVEKENNTSQAVLNDNLDPPEDFEAYDREWLKQFQKLSFKKGLYTALASATFFGMFSIITGMLLDKVGDPQKKITFRVPQSPLLMSGLTGVGVWFAYLANVKESHLRKMEEDRLAHRIKAGEEKKSEGPEQLQGQDRLALPKIEPSKDAHKGGKWQDFIKVERLRYDAERLLQRKTL